MIQQNLCQLFPIWFILSKNGVHRTPVRFDRLSRNLEILPEIADFRACVQKYCLDLFCPLKAESQCAKDPGLPM